MNKKEVDEMFNEAGVTWDDLHNYTFNKYIDEDNMYKGIEREDIQGVIKRIKEWKNGIKND